MECVRTSIKQMIAMLGRIHELQASGQLEPLARGLRHRRRRGPDLHHLYRAMAWLGEELPAANQDSATPFAPRCVKDVFEEDLFAHRRDLLATLDVVFKDTTSLCFEGAGGQTLGRRGFSKDHRPDLNQMILAVLLDGDGRTVCTQMWPGKTTDVSSLIPAVDRLQRRFRINRVCVVADRGVISADTIAELEARKLLYVLGVRERSDRLVQDVVFAVTPAVCSHDPRQAQGRGRLRSRGGGVGRTALCRVPQSRPDEEGRR